MVNKKDKHDHPAQRKYKPGKSGKHRHKLHGFITTDA